MAGTLHGIFEHYLDKSLGYRLAIDLRTIGVGIRDHCDDAWQVYIKFEELEYRD